MQRISSTVICFFIFALIFGQFGSVQAQIIPTEAIQNGFNPNAVLEDNDIFKIEMGYNELKDFLRSKGGLGQLTLTDIDGTQKSAAEIIWRVANTYTINPKYILALLQKEQSLVEDPAPSQRQLDWATGYGVCDNCSKDDPRIQAFKGFANQVEWAAKQHREKYLFQLLIGGSTISGYAPGIPSTVDGLSVIPRNNATAMLYSYTPHIHGNLVLWNIWQRWFNVDLPDGTLVKAMPSGDMYLIRFGFKRKFKSVAVAASMVDLDKMIEVPDEKMVSIRTGEPISFPNYSIIHIPDGRRFLIVGETKRHIKNMAVFRSLGFTEDDVVPASMEEADGYVDGRDIDETTQHPTGLVVKSPDGNIWYVEDNTKSRIPNRIFLTLYFSGRNPLLLPQDEIDALETLEPYKLRDGELIKSEDTPTVYVVENGELRPIVSGEVFEGMGWKWHNVISLPNSFIESYPKSETFNPPQPDAGEAVQLTTGS